MSEIRFSPFKKGDRVEIISNKSKYRGRYGTVVSTDCDITAITVDGTRYSGEVGYIRASGESYVNTINYMNYSLRKLTNDEKEKIDMKEKLTGFKQVAVITVKDYKQGTQTKYYALYDNDVCANDKVMVSGEHFKEILTVEEVISLDTALANYTEDITEEVICKLDFNSYNERIKKRKTLKTLREQMDIEIKKMQEADKYAVYAEKNPKFAEMFELYLSIKNS